MTSIAFIGLGNMGGPMALNLVRAGMPVAGLDRAAAATAKLAAGGGRAAKDLGDALHDADVVVTMLPAGTHVRNVYLGQEGVIARARPNSLFIDCSTIDVDTARAVATAAEAAGHAMLDAPVSGGTGGAAAGTLTFMVGGSDAAVARARPILQAMGKTLVHTGGPGAGQAAKICNNMLLGISMIGVAEAFALADRLGLDRQKLFDVSSTSSGQCWSLTTYCPVPGPVPTSPANRGYAPGFTAAMMLKDLQLAQSAALSAGAATPLGAAAAQIYQLMARCGRGEQDFSAVFELLAKTEASPD